MFSGTPQRVHQAQPTKSDKVREQLEQGVDFVQQRLEGVDLGSPRPPSPLRQAGTSNSLSIPEPQQEASTALTIRVNNSNPQADELAARTSSSLTPESIAELMQQLYAFSRADTARIEELQKSKDQVQGLRKENEQLKAQLAQSEEGKVQELQHRVESLAHSAAK